MYKRQVIVLTQFLRDKGIEQFESVTLAAPDGAAVTLEPANLTDDAVLIPHKDGMRFRAENLHISTWLKGNTRIIVVGTHKPLTIDGQEIDFSGGRGYIEKDWGRGFPEAWVWLQTNHFEQPGTSLTASIAIIPWVRTAFPGFIIGLWHDGRLYRFATYTGAKTERLAVTEHTIEWVVGNREYRMEMFIAQGEGSTFGLLKGPDPVEMGKRVAESLSATLHVRLTDRAGRVLFEGTGRNAGLEVHEGEARLLGMVGSKQ